MTLSSKPLALVIFIVMFGGIGISSALGWWQTQSTKEPAKYAEGEFAGEANPADIRGSYTFGDIAQSFNVTPEILAQAFQVTNNDPAVFAVKELESIYLDSGYEIGTNSVRLFVAYYLGLPFDVTGQEIYLPVPAVDILMDQAILTPEQLAYVQAHMAGVQPASSTQVQAAPEAGSSQSTPEAGTSPSEEYVVKGKTIFGDLLRWGVPQEAIEQVIGTTMPDPAMRVKDFATANGLDFETIRTQLQGEVDEVKPK